jgi:hypothetical protein
MQDTLTRIPGEAAEVSPIDEDEIGTTLINEPYRRVMHRRLKESYGPTYLTLLSIIQGVALGDLASVVGSGHQHFTVVQWVLTLNTFGVLIIIWDVFSAQSVLWDWIPDVRDGSVLFVVGALELFLHHAIVATLSTWLIALSLIGLTGAIGTFHIRWRSSHEPENLELLRRLNGHIQAYTLYLIGGVGLFLLLAWLSFIGRLDAAAEAPGLRYILALGVALLTTAALGGSLLIFHTLWQQALAYARTNQGTIQRRHGPEQLHPRTVPAGARRSGDRGPDDREIVKVL